MEANCSHKCSRNSLLKGGLIGGALACLWFIALLVLQPIFRDTSVETFLKLTLLPATYIMGSLYEYLADIGLLRQEDFLAVIIFISVGMIIFGFLGGTGFVYLVHKIKHIHYK